MKRLGKMLCLNKAARGGLLALLCFFVLQGLFGGIVWAKAVPPGLAHKMVNGWLAKEAKPMGSRLGSEVENVETFADTNGQAVYYVVYLRPNGFVIVPADDLVEPVVCFSPGGSFDPSQGNPLGALVSRDLPGRVDAAREIQKKTTVKGVTGQLTKQQSAMQRSGEKAFGKWNKLLGAADNNGTGIIAFGTGGISDVRVSPLLQSEWSQAGVCSKACYNYYTPPGSEGGSGNYPCGCVATAMAQYMRFWQYPTTGAGTGCFTVSVNGRQQTKCLRGGDGSGGPYDWADMALVPDCSATLAQRQAIGALTYDAGIAVHMDYESSGSGAYMNDVDAAMTDTFGYSNSILGYNSDNNIGAGLNGMINPNLDMGNPVIIAIYNSSTFGAHAVVADGYGYNSSTLYHHLNMGWSGVDNAWYNLPNIDAPSDSFNVIYGVIYNIFISGSGEIISGRITDSDSGLPISGVTVTATRTGGGTYQATTNADGIYALTKVLPNSTYTVSVVKSGYSFADQVISTGLSQDNVATSGNCWAIDFVLSEGVTIPVVGTFDSDISGEVTFTASTDSNHAVSEVYFCLRSPNGGNGVPIGYENLPADFNYTSGEWQYSFDTTQVSDGNYVILASAVDVNDTTTWSDAVPVFINNATLTVKKCTVRAGRYNNDCVSFSGTMSANADEISAASEVVVDINSANMVERFVQAFPRDLTTFKKGRFSSTIIDRPFKTSFAFNTTTSKFSFSARNLDLTGLSCPLTVRIKIGDYNAVTEVNEAVVNGKKPMPIQLLMGIKNSLRADKWKFTRDRHTGNITRAAVRGGFSVGDLDDANMATNPFSVTVGPQTFTVPAVKFKANKRGDKFTCSKVTLSGGEIAYATFNFSKRTFTLTLKNTNFAAEAGEADFLVDFASFSGIDEVTLPP